MPEDSATQLAGTDPEVFKAMLLDYLTRKHPPAQPLRGQPRVDNSEELNQVAKAVVRGMVTIPPVVAGDLAEEIRLIKAAPKSVILPEGWTEKDSHALAETSYHLFRVAQEYGVDASDVVATYGIAARLHFKEGPDAIAQSLDKFPLQKPEGTPVNITAGVMLSEAIKKSLGQTATWTK